MAVIDVTTYNGEKELFEIRYNILKDYVDEFIVVEFDKTFSGNPKEFKFPYAKWDRVRYFKVSEEQYSKYYELAESSPNTKYGKEARHWVREFAQKESIKDCLTHLDDEDILYIGDADEIWSVVLDPKDKAFKLNLYVYTYYLNQRSSEQFWGTLLARYSSVKNECLNHLRVNAKKMETVIGWHFTSLKDNLKQKLLDSYTEETYATKWVMDNLAENVANDRDFLGRDFRFWLSEEEWPEYLTNNRDKYKHLIKNYETTK